MVQPRNPGAGQPLNLGNTMSFASQSVNDGDMNAQLDQVMGGGFQSVAIGGYVGQGDGDQALGAIRTLYAGELTQGSLMLSNGGSSTPSIAAALTVYMRLADFSQLAGAATAMAPIVAKQIIPAGVLLQPDAVAEFNAWTDDAGNPLDLIKVAGGTQGLLCSVDMPASTNANDVGIFVNWILVG